MAPSREGGKERPDARRFSLRDVEDLFGGLDDPVAEERPKPSSRQPRRRRGLRGETFGRAGGTVGRPCHNVVCHNVGTVGRPCHNVGIFFADIAALTCLQARRKSACPLFRPGYILVDYLTKYSFC